MDEKSVYGKNVCSRCGRKQGLEPSESKMFRLEIERSLQGKELNKNDLKGLLMEQAVSDALHSLKISHAHNPFNITYPCYQNKRPDIVIEKLDTVIECKNLNKKQIEHSLSQQWLDKNIIQRKYFAKYKRKIALFSFRPLKPSITYLHHHGWKVYSLGMQILTLKQQRVSRGILKQRLYWLQKEYYKEKPLKEKGQTNLEARVFERKTAIHQNNFLHP